MSGDYDAFHRSLPCVRERFGCSKQKKLQSARRRARERNGAGQEAIAISVQRVSSVCIGAGGEMGGRSSPSRSHGSEATVAGASTLCVIGLNGC